MPQALPVLQAVAAVGSLAMQSRAARASSRAAATQQRQQEVQALASRRRSLRAAQVQRARTLASAQGMGATGGSGVAGGLTSLSSQLGGALGYQTQMSGLSREISGFSQQAARATSQARLLGEVDVFAGRLNNSGIFDNFLSGGTVE
jgi:hypothetical protein